jgi:SOS-response transcriptional repressor LexA
MTKSKAEEQRAKKLGKYVQERRMQLGLKRPEFIAEMERLGESITADHLAKLEGGHRYLQNAAVSTREAIRTILKIDPETWYKDTGLYVPTESNGSKPGFLERVGYEADFSLELPAYGSLAAGIHGFEHQEHPERFMRFDRRELPQGVNLRKLYVVRVNGDSMYQENMRRPIPDGAWLVVEAGAVPAEGSIVVAYIPEKEIGVVKEYARVGNDVVLRSFKRGGPMFWSSEFPDMRVQGVVRAVTYKV